MTIAAPEYSAIHFPAVQFDDVPQAAPQDQRFWSVTTILGALDKPGLAYWAAEQTAVAAIRQRNSWQGMLADDDTNCDHSSAACQVVKWLRDAQNRRPRDTLSAADLGTAVHALCESYALTGTKPSKEAAEEEVRRLNSNAIVDREAVVIGHMVNRFDEWAQRARPRYQAAEVTVYSPTYGFAGTADGFLTVDDPHDGDASLRTIADYKTSREPYDSKGRPKTPYPEAALQVTAYSRAEFASVWRPRRMESFKRRYYLLSEQERERAVPVPEVDAGLVIHITPRRCDAFPVRITDEVWRYFLHVQEVARWTFEESKTAVGQPIEFR